MTYYIMSDGTIKRASDVLAAELIKRGARELKLQPITIDYGNQTGGSTGALEVPKPRRSSGSRSRKRKVPGKLD
jgi:hypothetical protein